MKINRKNALKIALRLQKEYTSKVSLWDLLETHSWILMQEGYNPYAGIRAVKSH